MRRQFDTAIKRLKSFTASNQGFTLVELVTSLMIFSFFSIALLQYMNTAAKVSTHVNGSTDLSVQSQVALGLIEEYMIDCSGMVQVSNSTVDGGVVKTLYIVNNQDYDNSLGSHEAIVYAFEFVEDEKTLYYYDMIATRDTLGDSAIGEILGYEYTVTVGTPSKEMVTKNIDAFDVKFYTGEKVISRDSSIEQILSVDLSFEMSSNTSSQTYVGSSYILMRNTPTKNDLEGVGSNDSIYEVLYTESTTEEEEETDPPDGT